MYVLKLREHAIFSLRNHWQRELDISEIAGFPCFHNPEKTMLHRFFYFGRVLVIPRAHRKWM